MTKILSVLTLGTLWLASLPAASAQTPPVIRIADNAGNSLTIDSTGLVTFGNPCVNCVSFGSSGQAGYAAFMGTIGNISIGNAQGVSKPNQAYPDLAIVAVNNGSPTATLTVSLSDVSFTGPDVVQGFPITTVTGGASATYTYYIDNTNALFGAGSLVGTLAKVSSTPASTPTWASSAGSTFSATETEVLTLPAGSTFNGDNSMYLTPPSNPLSISCAAASGTVGTVYTSSIGASGGISPYTFQLSTGALPAGLTLNTSSGLISGTPTAAGTFSFTVLVTDSSGSTATSSCPLTVALNGGGGQGNLTLACPAASGSFGGAYSSSLVATGGVPPYFFSVANGVLPAGLVINSSTGAISGTASISGSYSFTAHAVDSSAGSVTATASCGVSIRATCNIPASQTIISNTSWNKFNYSGGGDVVWINAHIGKPSGVPTTSVTRVDFTAVSFTMNGVSYPMPSGHLVFDPSAPVTPATVYGTNGWTTTLNPNDLSDEIFIVGAPIPVTSAVAGGGQATFSFTTASNDASLGYQWQWSAAVYTDWPANPNSAQILAYHNADHAGTPMNKAVQASLIQGPRGGGGSNYTGSWSATASGACVGNSH